MILSELCRSPKSPGAQFPAEENQDGWEGNAVVARLSDTDQNLPEEAHSFFVPTAAGGWLATQILESPYSFVSKQIFATERLFYSIFQDPQD